MAPVIDQLKNEDSWIPRPKAAAIAGLSVKQLYRLERKGKLESFRVADNCTVVSRESLIQLFTK